VTHALVVRNVVRWEDFNEYEGEVHGELDGTLVEAYLLGSIDEWDNVFRPGAALDVDAWIERSGEFETLPAGSPAELKQVDGVVYEITGTVTAVDGEQLLVESALPMRVDLDLGHARANTHGVNVGDTIRVRGMLKVDLPDEE
jgi:hypothetical protein